MKTYDEMERDFRDGVRRVLVERLMLLTDGEQRKFKLIFGSTGLSLEEAVNNIHPNRLPHAMRLVETALNKREEAR